VNIGFALVWMLVSMELSRNYSFTTSNIIKKLTREYQRDDFDKNRSLKDRIMVTTNLSGMKYLLNYQRNYQSKSFQKTTELISESNQQELGIINGADNQWGSRTGLNFDTERDNSSQFSYYDADESLKINDIEPLAISPKIKDRIRAIKMIEDVHDPKYYGILKMLIRDPDDEVKRNAIGCAATNYNSAIIAELLEYINNEDFSDLVTDALVSIGSDSVAPLENMFQKSDVDSKTQARVIRIIGRISSENAQSFLLEKLVYPNKWIVIEAVNALNEEKFKFAFNDYSLIDRSIHNTCGAAAWLLAMDVSLHEFSRQTPVKKALEEEYQVTIDLLFKLLQLKYNEGVIQEVKKCFIGESANEERELSVEILGTMVEKDIKAYLFPLLHNNRKKEKVMQLRNFFPIEEKEATVALREIINSDLGYVNLWTKACALDAFIGFQDINILEDIYAQVFNPDPLLSELSFLGIYKWRKEVSPELFDRLSNHMKKRVGVILDKGEHYEYQMLFNKVRSLQNISYFEKVKGHYLISLAEVLVEHYLEQGESLFIQCSEEEVLPVFLVPFGDVTLKDAHKRQFKLNHNYLYGLGLYAGGITLTAYSKAVIYIAKPEQLGSLVLNHEELSDSLNSYIQSSNFY
ncbi:MAG TPA: HEAT repeat domain-containing protein, partial [Bacteroidales bacterium]